MNTFAVDALDDEIVLVSGATLVERDDAQPSSASFRRVTVFRSATAGRRTTAMDAGTA